MINQLTGQPIEDSEIKSLSAHIEKLAKLRSDIAQLEEKLENIKAVEAQLSTTTIPDKMKELGISQLSLADGRKVIITPFYSGSINKENLDDAVEWLRENEHDGILKQEISCRFDRNTPADKVDKIMAMLRKAGMDPAVEMKVHPQTMKAFVREMAEQGTTLPDHLFKTYIGNVTKIS